MLKFTTILPPEIVVFINRRTFIHEKLRDVGLNKALFTDLNHKIRILGCK